MPEFEGNGILSDVHKRRVVKGRIHDPGEDIYKWREAARQFSEIMKQNADRVWKPEAGWRVLH